MNSSSSDRRWLAVALSATFVLAVLMGIGPGLYLVNPNPADPNATFTFLGVPKIYAWAVFWFFVQAAVVLAAYCRLWDGVHADDLRRHDAPNENARGEDHR